MMVFFMNFSVVILNVNPFLKFDGYWIVSDLLEGKDLYAVSSRIVKKWMRFEKSGEENVMIVYAVLRTVFVFFILFTLLQVFYRSVYSLVTNGKMESSGVFIVVFLMLLFYRIFKKRKSKKNERLA
jgi:Zn-dependent protease